MKKTTKVAIATLIFTAAFAGIANADWEQENGAYKYLMDSGAYAREQLINVDGANYYFDSQSYMVRGWKQLGNDWYYFNPATGARATGWIQDGANWYYLTSATGIMNTGWLVLPNNVRYYLGNDGIMRTGRFTVDNQCYRAHDNGRIYVNEKEISGAVTVWYDNEGRMWYKNAKSRAIVSEWIPFTEDNAGNFDFETYNDAIGEKMDDLYEYYQSHVMTGSSANIRKNRREQWKEKVNRELSALGVDQTEIDVFINEVISSFYN